MDRNNTHIALFIPESDPEIVAEKILEDLKKEELNILIKDSLLGQPMAALEWFIPTAIGIFVLKPYFESFLKAAGKDHYDILKKWIVDQMKIARNVKVTTLSATTSPNKLSPKNNQSKSFSLLFELKTGQRLKLLFDETLSNEDWALAIKKMSSRVEGHYENFPKDDLTNSIYHANLQGNTLFGIINNETKEWTLLDSKKIYAIEREARRKDITDS